ncbi:MAG TPA: hypothetical protein VGB53_02755 [Rubricoccaceae bacterium]|jgi:hypothetical protein
MLRRLSPSAVAGLAAGLLFFLHALVPNSHAWPMVWPVLGGIAAVTLAARRHRLEGFWSSVASSLKAGALAGLVFLVTTAAALFVLSLPQLEAAARTLGSDGPVIVSGSVLVGLAAVAAGGALLAGLAGAVTFPFARLSRS